MVSVGGTACSEPDVLRGERPRCPSGSEDERALKAERRRTTVGFAERSGERMP